MKIDSIKIIKRNNETVFNLEVEDNNNYFANDILVSNCHKARTENEINKIIKKVKTSHKFGFTGTLPPNLLDQWNIIGKFDSVIYEKTAVELEKEKFVVPVKTIFLKLHYKNIPDIINKENLHPTAKYKKELEFIFASEDRNRIITQVCNKLDKNCLILVDFIKHGEALTDYLNKNCKDKKVYFIRGEVELEDRIKVIDLLKTEANIVCVAISKIFSVGIDIPSLSYIIFAAGGKAKVRTIQSVGRGRRLHTEKQQLIIFDIADQLKYGIQHSKLREQIYKDEQIPFLFTDLVEKS